MNRAKLKKFQIQVPEGMDLPLKEFALITGAALLARRRTKNEKES